MRSGWWLPLGCALALLLWIEALASSGGGQGIRSSSDSGDGTKNSSAAPLLEGAQGDFGASTQTASPAFSAGTWAFIGHIIYINLPAAAERSAALRRDFLPSFAAPSNGGSIGPPVSRFEAFEAPANMPGIYGAALSHIGALQLALDSGCESVLVLEDDVSWRLSSDGANLRLLQRLARQRYDVILLGATVVTFNASTSRVFYAHATSSYLVARHYMQTLIDNFSEGLHRLGREPIAHDFFIDVFWMHAMNAPGAEWFVVAPSLIVQEHFLAEYVGFSPRDTFMQQ